MRYKLAEQISNPVQWVESMKKLKKYCITEHFEMGPGKVLSGMVKRTIKNVNCFSINSITDITNLENELKK